MTVREITEGDVVAVQHMAARFLSEDGPYGGRFTANPACIAELATRMIAPGALGLIAEDDGRPVGMFGVFCFDHPITGQKAAAELCWWMEPEARGGRAAVQMLRLSEAWARDEGAQVLEMIAPSERVGKFYERVGYERTDVHYLKRL